MPAHSFQTGVSTHRRVTTYIVRTEDITAPLIVQRDSLETWNKMENSVRLNIRHSLSQRTNIRLQFDCLVKLDRRSAYKNLKRMSARLSCPTPEQAELAIDAILAFAQSLDGKWLAPAQDSSNSQIPQPPIVSGLGADSQAISEGLDRADQTAPVSSQDTPAPPTPPLKSPDRGERD